MSGPGRSPRAASRRRTGAPDRHRACGKPDAVQVLLGDLHGLGLGQPADADGRLDQVAGTVMCGKRLKSWKTIWADSRSVRICSRCSRLRALKGIGLETDVAHLDRAHRRLLEEVRAAQQRRLAAPRPPDDADGLLRIDLEVAAAQDVVGAEVLLDAGQADDRFGAGGGQPARLRIRIDAVGATPLTAARRSWRAVVRAEPGSTRRRSSGPSRRERR